MEKAIIYARQSFGQEQDSASIAVQIEECHKWAKAHNITVVGDYQDANTSSELFPLCEEGIEASKIDRGFQRWLKSQRTAGRKQFKEGLGQAFNRIEEGGITHLLVYTRNRLGRTADGSYLDRFLTNFLLEHKVSLVCVQDGTTMDFSDNFMTLFQSFKDALDYRGLQEKARASLASIDRRINSYTKWSNAFGVEMKDGQVLFKEEYIEAIKFVFSQVAKGASYCSIQATLNNKWRHLFPGRQCYQSTLLNILKNPVYAGCMTNREGVMDRAKNIPQPPISLALWQEVRSMMEYKKKKGGVWNVSGERKHWLPVSGYLRCHCGRRMIMRWEREKIVYECNNPDHTNRIDMSDAFLKTLQCIFVISLVNEHRRLASMEKEGERIGQLRLKIGKLQDSLRAKMTLVETDEDITLYKPIMDGLKEQIAQTKQELLEAESLDTTEQVRLREQLEQDFHDIMEQDILDHMVYQRLLKATIDFIEVEKSHIKICLTDGRSFDVPRLEGKHHARRLMKCTITCDTDNDINGICHYSLHFFDGEPEILGGKCIMEDENLSVFVHEK